MKLIDGSIRKLSHYWQLALRRWQTPLLLGFGMTLSLSVIVALEPDSSPALTQTMRWIGIMLWGVIFVDPIVQKTREWVTPVWELPIFGGTLALICSFTPGFEPVARTMNIVSATTIAMFVWWHTTKNAVNEGGAG